MDRVRLALNGLVKGEGYSRFTLQPSADGERHAEVDLCDDVTDGATETEAPDSPSFRPARLHNGRRLVAGLLLAVLLTFLLGYMASYVIHGKRSVKAVCEPKIGNQMDGTTKTMTASPTSAAASAAAAPPPDVQPSWKDLTQLLAEKLTSEAFGKTLGDFARPSHAAGSEEDSLLGNKVFDAFKELDMKPWTDVHYVQLQMPDGNRPNSIQFGSSTFTPPGYLAYSATGKVQGRLVYGNYGRVEDLAYVQNSKVELNGSVLLLRAGKISFAEQVDNAATKGASAVLIYPDSQDFIYNTNTALYGHVHLGSGDPYTPGFPSFNHTQFPPTKSSGLPRIPAQTVTAETARTLLQTIGGPESKPDGFKGGLRSVSYSLGGSKNVTVEVNNVLVNKGIHNVFGVIKGFSDPDRYVVLGAQRDAWGKGYAKATVGTSVLVELAKVFHEMVENGGFRPKRSLVFASWSAGEYGSIGATEWLEGYMSSIDRSVFTYINLDGVVLGRGSFSASASPLLYSLIGSTMKEVQSPFGSGTLYEAMGEKDWTARVMRPMTMDDPSYPFLAFSGIPSVSFHFTTTDTESYTYYGTGLDNVDHLNYQTNQKTKELVATAAEFAGLMAMRLVHDHLLSLDVSRYQGVLTRNVKAVYNSVITRSQTTGQKDVDPAWLSRALGSFGRAASSINNAIINTDLSDPEACRLLNNRIMKVEHCLLSPYVSPVVTPFRHLLFGRGAHTLASIAATTDMKELHTQLALATWIVQGCADAMATNIWDIDNLI
ncbi:transferrin receptor 1b [Cololabis saira]|uniref:transferrin receptor 1b n=1 Tax=Cololabis saira TaxID=129043 RepID=UPI002AD2057F|nr:transferrin receptor 1b [Cololabis saira]